MPKSDGISMIKVSLGGLATAVIAAGSLAVGHVSALGSRVGDLERNDAAIIAKHDAQEESTQRQLTEIKTDLNWIRNRLDQ